MRLFVLVTLDDPDPTKNERRRTVGVFTSHAGACDAVVHNLGDLYEDGYYPYAVVESIESDEVYGGEGDCTWFRWAGGYRRIEAPGVAAGICGWGVG